MCMSGWLGEDSGPVGTPELPEEQEARLKCHLGDDKSRKPLTDAGDTNIRQKSVR